MVQFFYLSLHHTNQNILIMATTRENLMAILKAKYPSMFLKTTEEFDGGKGGIWVGGENGDEAKDGRPLFDYYTQYGGEVHYVFGVHKEIGAILEKNGWYAEWYDAGTLMFYEM